MRNGRLGPSQPPARKTHAVIVFWVGPYRMGIEAGSLKEIRNEHRQTATEVCGATIVSSHTIFGVNSGKEERLLVLRPGRVAIRVDRVDRMIETGAILPLPRAFQGAESEWYCGLIRDGEIVFPMLKPEMLALEGERLEAEILAARLTEERVSPVGVSL
jgi:hypothetical protein